MPDPRDDPPTSAQASPASPSALAGVQPGLAAVQSVAQSIADTGVQTGVLLARKALVPLVGNAPPRCPRCGTRLAEAASSACPHCGVAPTSAEAAAMLVPGGGVLSEALRGAAYVPRGFWMILTTPRLWPVAALPLLFNIVFMVGVIWFTKGVVYDWFIAHTGASAFADWHGGWVVLELIIRILGGIMEVVSFILIPLIAAWLLTTPPFRVIFAALSTLVGGRTEQLILEAPGKPAEPFNLGSFQASLAIAVVDSLLLAVLELTIYIVASPIALIPVVGTLIWFIVPRAVFAALDQSDPSFCRKNYKMSEKIALWRERPWRFFGFGLAFFFFLTVPFVNALIFPVVAAGGAMLYLELDRK